MTLPRSDGCPQPTVNESFIITACATEVKPRTAVRKSSLFPIYDNEPIAMAMCVFESIVLHDLWRCDGSERPMSDCLTAKWSLLHGLLSSAITACWIARMRTLLAPCCNLARRLVAARTSGPAVSIGFSHISVELAAAHRHRHPLARTHSLSSRALSTDMASSNPFEVRGTITVIDSATVLCVRRRRCAYGDDEGHAALLTPEDVGGADNPFFQVRATSHAWHS
jgi:hypothetical protein